MAADGGDMAVDEADGKQAPQITEALDLEEFSRQLILRTDARAERSLKESNDSIAAVSVRSRDSFSRRGIKRFALASTCRQDVHTLRGFEFKW